jgi:dihydrofolate reductase/thymidylate synthase
MYYKNELGYLKLLEDTLKNGENIKNRNGNTYSTFGNMIKFENININFPLLTTKKVYWKGVVEELLWFLKGNTDSKLLENKKINIWKTNSTKKFIDSMNLNYNEGDIGPMYGFNWKYFGADYTNCNEIYDGKGFDQLSYCMNLLKNDPYSRRIIMTTYDPSNAKKGVCSHYNSS